MIDALFLFSVLNPSCYGKDEVRGNISYADKKEPPANIRVKLVRQFNTEGLLSVFTDSKGNYTIDKVDLLGGPYFLIAHDPAKKYNGVIADNIGGDNVDD